MQGKLKIPDSIKHVNSTWGVAVANCSTVSFQIGLVPGYHGLGMRLVPDLLTM